MIPLCFNAETGATEGQKILRRARLIRGPDSSYNRDMCALNLMVGLCLAGMAMAADSPADRTEQALNMVLAGHYDSFYALFSAQMRAAISLEAYAQQSAQIFGSLGKPTQIDPPQVRSIAGYTVVVIPLHWPAVSLNFQVSWASDGKVAGTFLRPTAPPPYQEPAYSHPEMFTAREVTIGSDRWKLPGTLLVPKGKGPFAGVVLVHGSGPNDRDESVGGVRVFRDLAEGLASRGVAVLRYDKRTKVYPAECQADPNFTMTEETVVDAVRALALLRTEPLIDPHRVFVLGHSQGAYMAPRIMQADPKLAGAILLAGNVRPLEELILEQTEYLAKLKGVTEAERAQLEALRHNPSAALAGLPEKYRDDLKNYNPVTLAKSIDVPMLILQGERDYQVTMKDFDLWKTGLAGRKNVTLLSLPGLNHLFVAGEGPSSPEEYEKPAHVAAEVIDQIAVWIGRQASASDSLQR